MVEKTLTPREIIDPEGTLPDVQLVAPEGYVTGRGISVGKYAVIHEGSQVGKALVRRNTRDQEQAFGAVRIDEDYRDKGFGMATYLAAIESAHREGHSFRTDDGSLTEASAKVWGKFITAGIAEVIEPIQAGDVQNINGTQLYGGHVRIAPPSAEVQPTQMNLEDLAQVLQGTKVDLGTLREHRTRMANPNSVGKLAVPFREGDIAMEPTLAYRQVGLEAVADLATTGIVRNGATAKGHEHPRWGHRVFWSQGEEGAHINAAGRAVMVAPTESLNDWTTISDLEAIYIKTPDGGLRNLLASQESSSLRHDTRA